MQFNLISKAPETIAKADALLVPATQTGFYHLVLEELAAAKRVELVGDEKAAAATGEDESPDELETHRKITQLAELTIGECPEDRTEEEHESMTDILVVSFMEHLEAVTSGFFWNEANSDQLNVLADVDWSQPKDLTWTTSENGGFVFVLA
ncbi:hypothetical protein [Vibrio phage phiKT1028]|nr:hypothetical protein [Vibrio phage phiKT1028]